MQGECGEGGAVREMPTPEQEGPLWCLVYLPSSQLSVPRVSHPVHPRLPPAQLHCSKIGSIIHLHGPKSVSCFSFQRSELFPTTDMGSFYPSFPCLVLIDHFRETQTEKLKVLRPPFSLHPLSPPPPHGHTHLFHKFPLFLYPKTKVFLLGNCVKLALK